MQLRCTFPRTVGYKADGQTLAWSPRETNKELAQFQLPCGKCISCRINYAQQWSIRCMHEAQMHENNCFVTLTYSDENLKSTKLVYSDWQKFMKKLRKTQEEPIGVFVTGEYGEQTKRPHWHAILFNYIPKDARYKYSNHRGDKVFDSESLTRIWGLGIAEFGSVTLQSANYVARYSLKKLSHGKSGEHDYEPISKKSSKHAIGRKWLEKYWTDVFNYGEIILKDGTKAPIPRYYTKWLKENKPNEWLRYQSTIALGKMATITDNNRRSDDLALQGNIERSLIGASRNEFVGDGISTLETIRRINKENQKKLRDNAKF